MCYTDYSENEDIKLMKIKKAFQASSAAPVLSRRRSFLLKYKFMTAKILAIY